MLGVLCMRVVYFKRDRSIYLIDVKQNQRGTLPIIDISGKTYEK